MIQILQTEAIDPDVAWIIACLFILSICGLVIFFCTARVLLTCRVLPRKDDPAMTYKK